MTVRPTDLQFMEPDREGWVRLVFHRQVGSRTAVLAHSFPILFLNHRYLTDQRWAWSTVAGVANRLSKAMDEFEANHDRVKPSRTVWPQSQGGAA